jgi:hypothetical protein
VTQSFLPAFAQQVLEDAFFVRAEHGPDFAVVVIAPEIGSEGFTKSREAHRQRIAEGAVEIEDEAFELHGSSRREIGACLQHRWFVA